MLNRKVRIGTRASALATRQAEWVREQLRRTADGVEVELVFIKTKGDKIQDVPLANIGGKGLFVKEIEEALLQQRVDLAVHSMKDVPAEIPEGLTIGCIPRREDPRDVLLASKGFTSVDGLPSGARVGTSSLRRKAQLLNIREDLKVEALRGNLDTRIRKLKSGQYDAIILAAAGLKRMDWENEITRYFSPDQFLPAIGQGALGIEIRRGDERTQQLVLSIHDEQTALCVAAERSFLGRLEGGCQVPIGGYCELENGQLKLTGMVASLDGRTLYRKTLRSSPEESVQLGRALAEELLSAGARKVLEEVYGSLGSGGS